MIHAVLVLLVTASAPPLVAQTDVVVEAGASQIGPRIGDDRKSARFGVGGLRASYYSSSGSGVSAGLLLGHSLGGQTAGDFFSASLGSTFVEDWGRGWMGGMDLRVMAFGIRAPFPYRAVAVEGGPTLRFRSGPVSVTTAAIAGVGRSRFEIWRVTGGRTRVFLDDLWRVGGTAELMLGSGTARAGLIGGVHETRGGVFGSGGGRVVFAGARAAVELSADVWSTPAGNEVTGGLEFVIPLAGWSLRGFVGRSEPDPLTLAEPGSGSGGLLVGRSLYSREPGAPATGRGEIVAESTAGARVRMRVAAPASAAKVELLGDFTLWEALPMERTDGGWELELEVPVGTHRFGYLVDGEWYVPADDTSVVEDEWGRSTAILVIEGEI